jgi:heme oxygenase
LGSLDLIILKDYRRFLEANAAALLPVERTLERSGVGEAFPDWHARTRRDAILDDLRAVDGRAAPLPCPGLFDFGGILGAMYVLEGSRLGAQFLLKAVKASPDPRVAGSVDYLGHGAGKAMWKSFLALLERHAGRLDDEAAAVDAAQRTFAMFERAAADA